MVENSVNQASTDLAGMSAAAAKEYILEFITTLKLTEKEIISLEEQSARWKSRSDLAASQGKDDLLAEAAKESARTDAKLAALREDERELRNSIDVMRKQLPGLAARERSVDPDLLEQELLMALGQTEEEAKTERAFRDLERAGAAGAALEALKAKMGRDAI